MRRAVGVSLLIAAGALAALAEPGPAPEAEVRTIEALIASVAGLTDASFERSGRSHSSAAAARFLREKWQSRSSEVKSADDFIERVATASSTTGRPYLIRFADGRVVPSADYLRSRLVLLRQRAPGR